MITFKTDFKPSGFERPVTGDVKEQIRSKLAIAGVVTLTVIFRRGPRGELVLHGDGPDEDIARAKAALSMKRETQIDPSP